MYETQLSNRVMKSTKVQTLGANIRPGVDALKSCCACGRLLESARVNEHVMESIRKQKSPVQAVWLKD